VWHWVRYRAARFKDFREFKAEEHRQEQMSNAKLQQTVDDLLMVWRATVHRHAHYQRGLGSRNIL
jgi:hypothetical protein